MIQGIEDTQQIFVSGKIWYELYPKVNPSFFLHALRNNIDLSKYGDGIQQFYFSFIVAHPNDTINRPFKHYSKKKKEADLAIEIPYQAALNASEFEVLKMMEAAYLEGIEMLKSLPLPAPFDIDAFKEDVLAIFAQDNWHEIAMEAA